MKEHIVDLIVILVCVTCCIAMLMVDSKEVRNEPESFALPVQVPARPRVGQPYWDEEIKAICVWDGHRYRCATTQRVFKER